MHRRSWGATFPRLELRGTLLRLDYVRRELATSKAPLAEIAASAGFFDQSHFSRVFKRHTGLTPTEFRRCFGLR